MLASMPSRFAPSIPFASSASAAYAYFFFYPETTPADRAR